jgi:hypothetical protein
MHEHVVLTVATDLVDPDRAQTRERPRAFGAPGSRGRERGFLQDPLALTNTCHTLRERYTRLFRAHIPLRIRRYAFTCGAVLSMSDDQSITRATTRDRLSIYGFSILVRSTPIFGNACSGEYPFDCSHGSVIECTVLDRSRFFQMRPFLMRRSSFGRKPPHTLSGSAPPQDTSHPTLFHSNGRPLSSPFSGFRTE